MTTPRISTLFGKKTFLDPLTDWRRIWFLSLRNLLKVASPFSRT